MRVRSSLPEFNAYKIDISRKKIASVRKEHIDFYPAASSGNNVENHVLLNESFDSGVNLFYQKSFKNVSCDSTLFGCH